MKKKYSIWLNGNEQKRLNKLIRKGSEKARKLTRCRVLLLSDEGKNDAEISAMLKVSLGTVSKIRRRYVCEGLESALNERPRPGAPKKYEGLENAKITALACSTPPEGHSRWSLRLLADKAVELEMVNEISHMSVGRILKKTNSSRT